MGGHGGPPHHLLEACGAPRKRPRAEHACSPIHLLEACAPLGNGPCGARLLAHPFVGGLRRSSETAPCGARLLAHPFVGGLRRPSETARAEHAYSPIHLLEACRASRKRPVR